MNSIYNNTLFALSRHTEAMFLLQEQASTGSRINRPSDDPTTSASILNLQSENSGFENDNLFILHWLMGTMQGSMEPTSMFLQLSNGLFTQGTYSTDVILTMIEIP